MAPKENANLNTLPVGRLGILPLQSCGHITGWIFYGWRKSRWESVIKDLLPLKKKNAC